jgi:hypothetical protein
MAEIAKALGFVMSKNESPEDFRRRVAAALRALR